MNITNHNFTFPAHIRTWVHPLEEATNTSTPEERRKYENALRWTEAIFNFGNGVPLKSLNEKQFHEYIRLVHSLTVTDPIFRPGCYRSKQSESVVIGKIHIQGGNMFLHLNQCEPESLPYFEEIEQRIKEGRTVNEMVEQRLVSPGALAFIDRYMLVCPDPKKVYGLMEQLRQEVQKRIESGEDPIDTAAFFHYRIGKIHPFLDGNGRIARIFTNVILGQAGLEPIAFAFNDQYTKAADTLDGFTQLVRNTSRQFEKEALIDMQLPKDYSSSLSETKNPA
jgi:prophage maintenance system killer protein